MPWKKQFDVDVARERARNLFWSRGYESTSMGDLLRRMGISRGSFYANFKSKRSLFTEVLRGYDRERRAGAMTALADEFGPRRRILALFEGVAEESRGRHGTRGCFLANSAVELAPKDKSVARIVRGAYEETESFVSDAITQGQSLGEISAQVRPRETARALLAVLLGMRVLARSGCPDDMLASIVEKVGDML